MALYGKYKWKKKPFIKWRKPNSLHELQNGERISRIGSISNIDVCHIVKNGQSRDRRDYYYQLCGINGVSANQGFKTVLAAMKRAVYHVEMSMSSDRRFRHLFEKDELHMDIDELIGERCWYNYSETNEYNEDRDVECIITGVSIHNSDVFGTVQLLIHLEPIGDFREKHKLTHEHSNMSSIVPYNEDSYTELIFEMSEGVSSEFVYGVRYGY